MFRPIWLLVLLTVPLSGVAGEYKSAFGFPIKLSDEWTVMTRQSVAGQFRDKSLEDLGLKLGDTAHAAAVLKRIQRGDVEFFFDKSTSSEDFDNNISAQLTPGGDAVTAESVKAACEALPGQLRSAYGEDTKVESCASEQSHGVRYVAFEYVVPKMDVTIVQREIPYLANTKLLFVGASNASGLGALKAAMGTLADSATEFAASHGDGSGTGGDASHLMSRQERESLVEETMHRFAQSVSAKDFSDFHQYISKTWREQVTVAELGRAAKSFEDNKVDFGRLDGASPVFVGTPQVDQYGVVSLKGFYNTSPVRVRFQFGYTMEDGQWKLARMHVGLKELK